MPHDAGEDLQLDCCSFDHGQKKLLNPSPSVPALHQYHRPSEQSRLAASHPAEADAMAFIDAAADTGEEP